jgi:hypothetical protein
MTPRESSEAMPSFHAYSAHTMWVLMRIIDAHKETD